MPKHFKVTVTQNATGHVEVHEGDFADAEWDRLQRFYACAQRLARCRLAESQNQLNWSVGGGVDRKFTVSVTLPPEDDILAFLHLMRPFVLKKEDTYFYDITNILTKHVPLVDFRARMQSLRQLYAGEALGYHIEIGTERGVTRLTSEDAVQRWLNAFEYHQFPDKRADIEAMYRLFPEQGTRAVFLTVLLSSASAIGKVAGMIGGFMKAPSES